MKSWFNFLSKRKDGGKQPTVTSTKKRPSAPGPLGRLGEILSRIEQAEVATVLPDLNQQVVLEVAPHLPSLNILIKERGVSLFAGLGTLEGYTIKGRWDSLPILSSSCDFVLCRASAVKKDLTRLIQESSRVLKGSGKALLVDLHPFSLIVQGEHQISPATEDGLPPGFERYFKMIQRSHLKIGLLKEVFVDSSLKKFFGDQDLKEFERLKKWPLMVLMLLEKESV